MNGKRLEQLTGIRSDHANETIRRLEALHLIITRRGTYGKWMSINFDFANWGKHCPTSETNDPRCLLSDDYRVVLPTDEAMAFYLHCFSDDQKTTLPAMDAHIAQSTPPLLPTQQDVVTKKKPKQPTKPVSSSTPFTLHFPDSFSKKLRNSIKTQLKGIKLRQQAQRLLDYFCNCLLKQNIRNPIGYFIGLKNRFLKGQLDLPEENAVVEKKKKINQDAIERGIEYQQAVADYKQVKTSIQLMMTIADCSFDNALRRMGYNAIWKTATQRLDAIKIIQKRHHQLL
jgi:hypothetical protein